MAKKITIAVLTELKAATDSAEGYLLGSPADYKALVEEGLAEQNSAISEGKKIATRITAAGEERLADMLAAGSDDEDEADEAAQDDGPSMSFDFVTEKPKRTRNRGGGADKYGLGKFPPPEEKDGKVSYPVFTYWATEEMPDPVKTLSTAVANFKDKFRIDTGKTKPSPRDKTKLIPVYEYPVDFEVHRVQSDNLVGAKVLRVR